VRPLSRAVSALCVVALAVPVWAVPASAQPVSATETASSVAYFTTSATPQPDSAPSALPNLVRESAVDGVGPGKLGVAAQSAAESKVSFLYFSLTEMPFGSTITSATLTVPLTPEDNANRRLNARPENVRVCAPDDSGFGGQDGAPMNSAPDPTGQGLGYQGAPERLCDQFQAPASGDDTAYVFDITGLAATWGEINDGVALTRTDTSDASFQVVFEPTATLTYEYTPPADLDTDLGGDFDLGTDLGTADFGSGDTSFGGFDGGSATSDFGGGDFGAGTAPLIGGDLPEGVAPETADEPAVAAVQRSAPGPIEVLGLTPGFFLGALLLAGILAFLGLCLGDRTAPIGAAAAKRPSRLSRALAAPSTDRPSLLGSRPA
jgi:hypothetical protein